MASEMKQNEDGMSDILQTNEKLLRVSDRYHKLIGGTEPEAATTGTENGTSKKLASSEASGEAAGTGSVATVTKTEATPTETPGAVGGGDVSDVLIDLADLNLGPPPPSASNSAGGQASGNMDLLGELGMLGEFVCLFVCLHIVFFSL